MNVMFEHHMNSGFHPLSHSGIKEAISLLSILYFYRDFGNGWILHQLQELYSVLVSSLFTCHNNSGAAIGACGKLRETRI